MVNSPYYWCVLIKILISAEFFSCFYFMTDVIPQAIETPKISYTVMDVLSVFSTFSTEYSMWLFLAANIILGSFTKHHHFPLQLMIFILKRSSFPI